MRTRLRFTLVSFHCREFLGRLHAQSAASPASKVAPRWPKRFSSSELSTQIRGSKLSNSSSMDGPENIAIYQDCEDEILQEKFWSHREQRKSASQVSGTFQDLIMQPSRLELASHSPRRWTRVFVVVRRLDDLEASTTLAASVFVFTFLRAIS